LYEKTPTLLSVAFGIQSKLQQEVCGIQFWNKQAGNRKTKKKISGRDVNIFDIDAIVHVFEELYPDLLTRKKKTKSELGYQKRRNVDGSRVTDVTEDGSPSKKKSKKKGGKYRPTMQLPEGEFNTKTSKYEELEIQTRPPRPMQYSKKRRGSNKVNPGKQYPRRGKLRKLKRHNSAKKLQAAYRGTVARKKLPTEQAKQKAIERRRRLSMQGKKAGQTTEGKRKRTKLARKKSLQSPKGRGAASFF
jgi:hypothetical protein